MFGLSFVSFLELFDLRREKNPSWANWIFFQKFAMETKDNLPWVEKYRPSALQDLISHEDIIGTIRRFIQEDKLPHLVRLTSF